MHVITSFSFFFSHFIVVLMFNDILRVHAGNKLGQDAIAFNVVSIKGSSKPPRYEPLQYAFIPIGEPNEENLQRVVKLINLAVFGHPCTLAP